MRRKKFNHGKIKVLIDFFVSSFHFHFNYQRPYMNVEMRKKLEHTDNDLFKTEKGIHERIFLKILKLNEKLKCTFLSSL